MKVSKLFHWLYASVMFIPLLIAPIFGLAVRSDNNFQPIEVQAQDYKVVDFNQQVHNGNFENTDYWFSNGGDFTIINNKAQFLATSQNGGMYYQIDLLENHKYYFTCHVDLTTLSSDIRLNVYNDSVSGYDATSLYTNNVDLSQYLQFQKISGYTSNRYFIRLLDSRNSNWDYIYWSNVQCFDLTQMFGDGNEPSIEDFQTWYPNQYYNFTLSKKELLNVGTTTLSDTDVGSQMVYTLYNATDKYFNFNQFLGFGSLFDWFQLNVFNGTAPLGFIIFWNLLIYWLLVSIAWLIFDIAMYVPKLAHRWLDKASLE